MMGGPNNHISINFIQCKVGSGDGIIPVGQATRKLLFINGIV